MEGQSGLQNCLLYYGYSLLRGVCYVGFHCNVYFKAWDQGIKPNRVFIWYYNDGMHEPFLLICSQFLSWPGHFCYPAATGTRLGLHIDLSPVARSSYLKTTPARQKEEKNACTSSMTYIETIHLVYGTVFDHSIMGTKVYSVNGTQIHAWLIATNTSSGSGWSPVY